MNTWRRVRSAITGRFVPAAEAVRSPETTVTEESTRLVVHAAPGFAVLPCCGCTFEDAATDGLVLTATHASLVTCRGLA